MKTSEKRQLFFSHKLRGIVILFVLFCSLPMFAQNVDITGTVTDETGLTVIGASVLVKGTTKGTITDFDGNYTLNAVPVGSKLEFSFIGMKSQTVTVGNKTKIDVVLKEDSELLDEVVVTALGMKREQKALGYAVTEVKGDDLKAANSISPVSSLQGKVAGVEIAQSDGGMFGASKIQIRGASTLSDNNQPIYVIDGVILDNQVSGNDDLNWGTNAKDYGNELKNLNPDDFETVSVLKGAAATALYGSRGLNGAVVITTKSGKGAKGIGVSVSQTFGFDVNIDYPAAQYEFGSGYWAGARTGYASGAEDNRWDDTTVYKNTDGKYTFQGDPGAGLGYGPRFDGREMINYDGSLTTYSPYKNGIKDFFQVGLNTNTNVAVRGGNDKTNFYTSLSYKKARSTFRRNTFERFSWMLKASHKISDKVTVEGAINFAHSKPRNAVREIGLLAVTGGLPSTASPKAWKDHYAGAHGGIANTNYGDEYGYVPGAIKNTWWNIYQNDYTQREYVIRPSLELNYQILDWLSFKAEVNMNIYKNSSQEKVMGSGLNRVGGSYALASRLKEQITTAGTFTASKTFDKLSVGGFFRSEFYATREQKNGSETKGGLIVPGQFFIGNSKETPTSYANIFGTKRMVSLVGAVNLGWNDQLFLDITGRNDWSSALVYSNSSGNNSYFYPSVSGSWLISNTFEMPAWISFAKLRASWAQVGNDTDPYRINQGYNVGRIETENGFIYTNEYSVNQILEANLKPERKNAWEVGADVRFWNHRVGVDATYYRENTKDQIMAIDVPWESGVDSKLVNAGNIQNQGVELSLNVIPIQTKDWEWSIDYTFTRNRSKIVSLHPDVANYIPLAGQPNNFDYHIGSVAKVGGAYGLLMSDVLPAKDEQGNTILKWSNNSRAAYAQRDGVVKEIGDINPKFLSSLSSTLSWKNLSLRVALDARVGGYVASYASRYGTAYGNTESSLRYREGHGGITWTSGQMDRLEEEKTRPDGSKYTEVSIIESGSYGREYHDGMIPEGVFPEGQVIVGVDGEKYDVGGKTYQELYKAGVLEPMHAGAHHYFANSWGQGVVNDDWYSKLSYIALREITLSYRFDKAIANKIGAQALGVSFTGRNLGYLYNSLPNNINPESIRGNRAGEFRSRSFNPYTASFMFSVNVDF